MRGVVQEIRESEGSAYLVRGPLVGDDEYREVLDRCRDFHTGLERERAAGKYTFAELEENEENLAKLETWVGKIQSRDRFGARLAGEARRAIDAGQEELEAFARSVYEAAADHDSTGPTAS